MAKQEILYETYPSEALKMAKEAAIKSTFQLKGNITTKSTLSGELKSSSGRHGKVFKNVRKK